MQIEEISKLSGNEQNDLLTLQAKVNEVVRKFNQMVEPVVLSSDCAFVPSLPPATVSADADAGAGPVAILETCPHCGGLKLKE